MVVSPVRLIVDIKPLYRIKVHQSSDRTPAALDRLYKDKVKVKTANFVTVTVPISEIDQMRNLGLWLFANVSVRSLVVLSLVGSAIYLAIVDETFRPRFATLVDVALGGYLGQLIPRGKS